MFKTCPDTRTKFCLIYCGDQCNCGAKDRLDEMVSAYCSAARERGRETNSVVRDTTAVPASSEPITP